MDITKTIKIFRDGTHTAMSGKTQTFTTADIQRMSTAYSQATRPAPLVLGHPDHDSPSFGVVKSLLAQGGDLYAVASVSEALVDLVKAGRYTSVSASFMPPGHPNNPESNSYYLRHLGFLGAMAPAVKGLGQLAFSDGNGGVFGDWLGIDFAEFAAIPLGTPLGRQAFHDVARQLADSTPGMSFAEAVGVVSQRSRTAREGCIPQGCTADPSRVAQHNLILNYQAVTGAISYEQAFNQLRAKGAFS